MVSLWVVAALEIIISISFVSSRRLDFRCPPCPLGGCTVPVDCVHGVHIDICGRETCAKGPGEKCQMRRFGRFGTEDFCGDGLYCHCGFCTGCSLDTFECFESTCVFPIS